MQDGADAVFIIHAEGSAERLVNALKLKDYFGSLAEILPAVTPETKDYEGHRYEAEGLHKPRYPFQLSTREVATFLSHRKAWSQIVNRGIKAALVLEDDVSLSGTFDRALSLAAEMTVEGMYVRVPFRDKEATLSVIAEKEGHKFFRPKVIGLATQCQLVSRGAAAALLATSEYFDRPVDAYIQMRWLHGADVCSVWPTGIEEISSRLGGSTIHSKRSSTALWLRKEIMRPIYRAQIWFKSTRGLA